MRRQDAPHLRIRGVTEPTSDPHLRRIRQVQVIDDAGQVVGELHATLIRHTFTDVGELEVSTLDGQIVAEEDLDRREQT